MAQINHASYFIHMYAWHMSRQWSSYNHFKISVYKEFGMSINIVSLLPLEYLHLSISHCWSTWPVIFRHFTTQDWHPNSLPWESSLQPSYLLYAIQHWLGPMPLTSVHRSPFLLPYKALVLNMWNSWIIPSYFLRHSDLVSCLTIIVFHGKRNYDGI